MLSWVTKELRCVAKSSDVQETHIAVLTYEGHAKQTQLHFKDAQFSNKLAIICPCSTFFTRPTLQVGRMSL